MVVHVFGLHVFGDVLVWIADKRFVVNVKALVDSKNGSERLGSDKGGRFVVFGSQKFCHRKILLIQPHRISAHSVIAGIESCENAGMSGQGRVDGAIEILKQDTIAGQSVDVGGGNDTVSVTAQKIRACRIQRNQDHVEIWRTLHWNRAESLILKKSGRCNQDQDNRE